jgi:sulfate transport system permease protein
MGEFGAVSVLSGHLRGITNTMPLYIELLYQAFDFTGAFAISSILVIMAVAILVLRNVLEYRGKKEAEREAGTEGAKSRKRKEKVSGQVEALTAGAARL